MTTIDSLLAALRSGEVTVVDLTAPLSPQTPVLQLPPPFANTIPLSMEKVSAFDDAGPFWGWNNIHLGEHTGTHLDAPTHWATGRHGTPVCTSRPSSSRTFPIVRPGGSFKRIAANPWAGTDQTSTATFTPEPSVTRTIAG